MQTKAYKSSNCSGIMAKSVIFLISSDNYGKTRTKFVNLKTSMCSSHHSGPVFIENWKRYRKKVFFWPV